MEGWGLGRGGRDFPESPFLPSPISRFLSYIFFPSTLKSEIAMSETPATRPAPKQRTYRKNQFLFA